MNRLIILLCSFFILTLNSCGSVNYLPEKEVDQLLQNGEYTFMAKRVNMTNYDVINVVNSIPYSTSSRMMDLDYGYDIVIAPGKVQVTLPYFGRVYNPSYDPAKTSFRFISTKFDISESAGRKNSRIITIVTHDQEFQRTIYLEVFKNGAAYAAISGTDRQPITYNGYLMKNEVKRD